MDLSSTSELELPGFRFHPTEEELLSFYLRSMVFGKKLREDIIGYLNIYNYDPKELPGLAKIGEREWYFFVPRDRKNGSGVGRPNRTTETGFWKATGSDRKILSILDPKKMLGLKKTLVFYEGRAPRGRKTDWVMNEYRLPDTPSSAKDIVLCKIYRKATSLKVLEQRAAVEEEISTYNSSTSSPVTPPMDSISFCNQFEDVNFASNKGRICTSLVLPNGTRENITELQVPNFSMDWLNQDSLWTLENLTPFLPMC